MPWCCASPGSAAEPAAPLRASNSLQEAGRTLLGPGCLLLAGLEAALKNWMALECCGVTIPPAGLPGQHPSGVGTKPPAGPGPELWSVLTGCCEAVMGGNKAEISPVAAGEVASEAGQPRLQRPLACSCSEHPSVTSCLVAGCRSFVHGFVSHDRPSVPPPAACQLACSDSVLLTHLWFCHSSPFLVTRARSPQDFPAPGSGGGRLVAASPRRAGESRGAAWAFPFAGEFHGHCWGKC